MIPLHERKNLRFYIDSAVHRQNSYQQDALIRAVQSEYGTLERSLHSADMILVHRADTFCEAYDHVPGALVDFRYIEDDMEQRKRGSARLPFINYTLSR